MGIKVQYNPSTGKTSYNPLTGKLQTVDITPIFCGRCTSVPGNLRVTLSGVTTRVACTTAGSLGLLWEDVFSDVNGEYILTPESPCVWSYNEALSPNAKLSIYSVSDCTGFIRDREFDAFTMSVIIDGSSPYSVSLNAGYLDNGASGEGFIFSDQYLPDEPSDCVAQLSTPNNQVQSSINAAYGGTAMIEEL